MALTRPSTPRWAWLCLAWLSVTGCAQDLTQIVLVVDSDLKVPEQLDFLAIQVDARGMGGELATRDGSLGSAEGSSDLPVTLALLHQGGPLGPLDVEATGRLAETVVVSRRVRVSFQPRRTLMLRLDLLRACVGVVCDEGQTCADGRCRPIEVDPEDLEPWTGEVVPISPSCTVETCNGEDDDCDGLVDEGFDLQRDPLHCGSCGNACDAPFALTACQQGECVVTGCEAERHDCDGLYLTGCESTLEEVENCGGCDVVCDLRDAYESCLEGRCTLVSCLDGFDNCDGRVENGCESELALDLFHCGSCDRSCVAELAWAEATCDGESCGLTCIPGFADCDQRRDNGCEADLSSPGACGDCTTICPEEASLCSGDALRGFECIPPPCVDPPDVCGFSCVDLATNPLHCGDCYHICPELPHASPLCVEGMCDYLCDRGFGDCDSRANNGCETPLNTTSACGSCGSVCVSSQNLASCVRGECFYAPCPTGDPRCSSGTGDAGPDGGSVGDAGLDGGSVGDAGLDGGAGPDAGLDADAASDSGAGCGTGLEPTWWISDYAWRRQLTVTENISGTLPADYSVMVELDTATMVVQGRLLTNGNDLRVVRWSAGEHQELDRRLLGANSANSRLWFKTRGAVNSADATYFLYYGNPGAGNPPAHWADSMGQDAVPSGVYLAADNFEDEAIGAFPGGWDGSHNYAVELDNGNRVLGVTGPDDHGDYLFAGDLSWTDVVVEARMKIIDYASNGYYGLFTRAESLTDFNTLWYGTNLGFSLDVYRCQLSSPTATTLTSSDSLTSFRGHVIGTTWHRYQLRLLGQEVSFFFDQELVGSRTLTAGQMTAGRMGLCAGYSPTRALWDDIVVRRYVSPEPTVTLGDEESWCP